MKDFEDLFSGPVLSEGEYPMPPDEIGIHAIGGACITDCEEAARQINRYCDNLYIHKSKE